MDNFKNRDKRTREYRIAQYLNQFSDSVKAYPNMTGGLFIYHPMDQGGWGVNVDIKRDKKLFVATYRDGGGLISIREDRLDFVLDIIDEARKSYKAYCNGAY